MAYGRQKYVDQAIALALSVKLHVPHLPICLVTDRAKPVAPFDSQVRMESFAEAGTVLKTRIYEYSPFEETLFIDSDCLVTRDFTPQLEAIKAWDFSPVVNTYLRGDDSDLWLEDVGAALFKVGGDCFPKFNGGVYFFRRSDAAAQVFAEAEAIRHRQSELGILDFDAAGPGEETLIGLALAKLGLTDLYDDNAKLMRTPLNATGRVHLDILKGECEFEKNGQIVNPAIVHFCGPWIDHPAYRIAVEEVASEKRLSAVKRGAIKSAYKAGVLAQRLANKVS